MNEYIILHDALNPEGYRLFKLNNIISWEAHNYADRISSVLKTEYKEGYIQWRIWESPQEIEALIMGHSPKKPELPMPYSDLLNEYHLVKENAELKEQLKNSNPSNQCCRETFSKLSNYYNDANINYFCDTSLILEHRSQLESWRQSFKDKIAQDKNPKTL